MAVSDLREINAFLKEYAKQVDGTVEQTIKQVANEAARKLKNESPKKSGKYAKGWAVQKDKASPRVGVRQYTVYGKDGTYQLAHLLEHGHATRTGGRSKAITHIAPVEEWAVNEAFDRITNNLERSP